MAIMNNTPPKASSLTHLHLLSIINTIVSRSKRSSVRVLDAGCGNGRLMAYLHQSFLALHPELSFEIYGFDIGDHGVQSAGFINETISRLSNEVPEVDWSSRVKLLTSSDSWGYEGKEFDVIISNQVLEHVRDKARFFSEVRQALVPGGYSINLAPLKHVIHEGHVFVPYSHRIRNYSALLQFMDVAGRLGVGKFKRSMFGSESDYHYEIERHADYVYHWTAYSTEAETLDLARSAALRADFRFSLEFYTAKCRSVLGLREKYLLRWREGSVLDAALVKLLRYISSVTLVCRNINTY